MGAGVPHSQMGQAYVTGIAAFNRFTISMMRPRGVVMMNPLSTGYGKITRPYLRTKIWISV